MPICSCLKGFEPKNKEEWNGGNWTNGCVRRDYYCGEVNQTGEAAREDGFLKLETMKLPYFAERTSIRAAECREKCLNNCSCMAYAYEAGIHCMTWTGSLIDLQKFPINGEDLYIRLDQSELETGDNKVVIIVPVVVGIITFAICTFSYGGGWQNVKVIYFDQLTELIIFAISISLSLTLWFSISIERKRQGSTVDRIFERILERSYTPGFTTIRF
ncbi:hypothetical protein LWI29_035102 [Acer saccharum]|uniref:Apple domain-containing protein n=1 Tax=Acer saccharum TaxID=4024 RepID=A0AA39VHJ6_ACESA|nr:hypothetical protein LWI29_035102 [Acer saccharum]